MSDSDWLESLKVGDEVAVTTRLGWGRSYKFAPVERVTATQIIVSGRRFNRRTGWEVGRRAYDGERLEGATPELKAEVAAERRRGAMLARLGGVKWREQPDEVLERVVAALEVAAPEQAELHVR